MTTDDAFMQLLHDDNKDFLWPRTGLSDSRRRSLKSLIENGKTVNLTTDKKWELLQKAGFYKRQDVDWGLKGGIQRD